MELREEVGSLGKNKKRRLSLIVLLLLISSSFLTYRLYVPTGALVVIETNSLYERGKDFFHQLLSSSQLLKKWHYPLPTLNKVLYIEGGEGRFPTYWSVTLPLNLSERDGEEMVSSIKKVFPSKFFSIEKRSKGGDFFLEVNFFFLKVHEILFQKKTPKAKLAIVIDDFGEFSADFDAFKSIEVPLTMSVLPKLHNSRRHAMGILDMGQELLLHQPMEPLNNNLHPGPGAIYAHMEREEIRSILEENLASLPEELVGVNNHMGSRVTLEEEVMAEVLEYLKERSLFFLDSSTVADSIAPALKEMMEMPLLINHLFIDNIDEYMYICEMLELAGERALKEGDFITIGHPRAQTARAIQSTLPLLERKGVLLVHLSSLIEEPWF